MKVVAKSVKNGQLLSITVLLEKEYEKNAYRSLPGIQTCPYCKKPVNPADKDMTILVPTPLAQTIPGVALELGTAVTKCSSCGKKIRDKDQCDLTSFPEVITYIVKLRVAYQAAAKKGGATSGKKR